MNSNKNAEKTFGSGGATASVSMQLRRDKSALTMTALQALKRVTSSAPRRLTASEIVLLRQSKKDEAQQRVDGLHGVLTL